MQIWLDFPVKFGTIRNNHKGKSRTYSNTNNVNDARLVEKLVIKYVRN